MPQAPLHSQPIPFITLPNWVKAATQCGFNIEPVFRRHGIQTDLVHLESATVQPQQMERVIQDCVRLSRGRHFPFVLGDTFEFDYLPDLQTFVTTAPTLREAARVFDWVRELINPMIRVHLAEDERVAALVLELGERGVGVPPYFVEATFAAVVKFGRQLLGGTQDFRRLTFRHAPPPHRAAYDDFFRRPVAFRQARNAIEFDRALLDQDLRGGFPALHQQAEYRVEQRLVRTQRNPTMVAAIESAFARKPALLGQGVGAVALELGIGARTLQRRLRDEGHSFAEVYDRIRARLAMQWLERGEADIESISEGLGFSDRRSFTRAFTRWAGVSPSAFRARKS